MSFLAKAGYGTRVPEKVIDSKLVSTFLVLLEIYCLIWHLFVCVTGSYFGLAESCHISHPIRLRSTLLSHSRLQFFFCGVSIGSRVVVPLYRASRSHLDTSHSVGLPGRVISLTQRLLPENTQHSQQTDIHAPGGVRIHNP